MFKFLIQVSVLVALALISRGASAGGGRMPANSSQYIQTPAITKTNPVTQEITELLQCIPLQDEITSGQKLLADIELNGSDAAFDFVCQQTNRNIRISNKLECTMPVKDTLNCESVKQSLCLQYRNKADQAMKKMGEFASLPACNYDFYEGYCDIRNEYAAKYKKLECGDLDRFDCRRAGYQKQLVNTNALEVCENR